MPPIYKLATLGLALGAATFAQASPLTSWTGVDLFNGPPTGLTLLSTMTTFFSGAGFSGELRSAAYSNAGTTEVFYQILNNPGSTVSIGSISEFGEGGSFSDALSGNAFKGGWETQTQSAFGIFAPGTAKAGSNMRFIYGYCNATSCDNSSYSATTAFVGYDWIDSVPSTDSDVLKGIAPGTASYTGMKWAASGEGFPSSYALATFYIDGQSVMALAPVPEPQTYAMFMAGLGMIAAIIRRRKPVPLQAH